MFRSDIHIEFDDLRMIISVRYTYDHQYTVLKCSTSTPYSFPKSCRSFGCLITMMSWILPVSRSLKHAVSSPVQILLFRTGSYCSMGYGEGEADFFLLNSFILTLACFFPAQNRYCCDNGRPGINREGYIVMDQNVIDCP